MILSFKLLGYIPMSLVPVKVIYWSYSEEATLWTFEFVPCTFDLKDEKLIDFSLAKTEFVNFCNISSQ